MSKLNDTNPGGPSWESKVACRSPSELQETIEVVWCMKVIVDLDETIIHCIMFTSENAGETYQRRGMLMIRGKLEQNDPLPRIDIFDDVPTQTITVL
jgi:hypothetical protein